MKDIKITIVETPLNQPLVDAYGQPDTPSCPKHKVGQTFISKGGERPIDVCDEAWNCLSRYAFALSSGAERFWDDWVVPANTAVVTCADAFRPVVFKLETVD